MTNAERARPGKVSQLPTSPSPTQDALTRLWKGADSSHGHHLEAVAELRERKRREQEAPRRRRRYRELGTRIPDPGETTAQPRSVPAAARRVECERCKRTVEHARSDRVAFPASLSEPVQHLLCSRCADEVRRGLLRLLAGQEPLPTPDREGQGVPRSIPARASRLAFRMGMYGLIGLAVFVLVTWLAVR